MWVFDTKCTVLKFPSLSRWIRTIGLKTKWETAKARKAFFSLSGWSGKDVAACLRRIEGVWGLEFVQAGANEHLLRQVREDDMKSSATPQDNVGQQWHMMTLWWQYSTWKWWTTRRTERETAIKQDWKRWFVKTEVLRLIQVARPCLGLVEVGSYLEFSVNPKLGSSIWAGNVKDTCAVFDC